MKHHVKQIPKKKLIACSFTVKALDSNSINAKRLETNFIDTVVKLSRIYRLKCPDTEKHWEPFLIPKFLTMVGLGMEKVKKEIGVNNVKHKQDNKN